uniref:Uncharacterized protein n=1 Tax=Candidatus Kentrum sp. DK TaxID=2126562 RepID=A0A450S136_9GAMM|nr:MAG: hypothetical protein BECKDK2373B_GA0170837_101053 [Candidatus Kentron sp. DK]
MSLSRKFSTRLGSARWLLHTARKDINDIRTPLEKEQRYSHRIEDRTTH